MKKGFDVGLSKKQIANIFKNRSEFFRIKVPPLEVIEQYTGKKSGKVKGDFFENCASIPDPAELNVEDKKK